MYTVHTVRVYALHSYRLVVSFPFYPSNHQYHRAEGQQQQRQIKLQPIDWLGLLSISVFRLLAVESLDFQFNAFLPYR